MCDSGLNPKQSNISLGLQNSASDLEGILSRVKDLLTDLESSCTTNPRNTDVKVIESSKVHVSCANSRLNVLQNWMGKARKNSFLECSAHLTESENSSITDCDNHSHSSMKSKETFSSINPLSCKIKDMVDVDVLLSASRARLDQFLNQLDNSFAELERSFTLFGQVATGVNCALAELQLSLAGVETSFCKPENDLTVARNKFKEDLLETEPCNTVMDEHWIKDKQVNLSAVMEDHIAKKVSLSTMCLHVLPKFEDELSLVLNEEGMHVCIESYLN